MATRTPRRLRRLSAMLVTAVLVAGLIACSGGPPPRDRCAATMSSLQVLEPTCWTPDAGALDADEAD